MKRLAIPGAILLGALVGVGGYFVAAKLGGAGTQPRAASAEDVAALRQAVVGLQDRMVKQEAKPSLKEALDDPTLREQLAGIVIEAQNPGTFQPRPPQPGSEAWRTSMTRQCRADYARLLEEARVVLKITDQEYRSVKPVFEKHFEPVEGYLRNLESGKFRSPPKINELVAPGLAATLAELQKSLPPEAWRAFEQWRRASDATKQWGTTQGDYFLDGEEYREYQARRGAARNWAMMRHYLKAFYEKTMIDEPKTKEVEEVLQAHLEKVYAWNRTQPDRNPTLPANMAKIREIAKETEAQLAKVLNPPELAAFKDWKKSAGMFSTYYFGEQYQPPPQPVYPPQPTPRPPAGEPPGPPDRF